MGAMASKKASESSPVRSRIACARAGEVSGPVATITLSHSAGGRPLTSSRRTFTSGCASSRAWTSSAKPSRSTAKALPAGTLWASAACRISEPHRRISSCSTPTALASASSDRKELEQTSSASVSVRWASVPRSGRNFVQDNRDAGPRRLPRRLAARQPAADDVDRSRGRWRIHGRGYWSGALTRGKGAGSRGGRYDLRLVRAILNHISRYTVISTGTARGAVKWRYLSCSEQGSFAPCGKISPLRA